MGLGGLSITAYDYDDDLIEAARRDGKSQVRVYRFTDTAVVIGRGSQPDVELRVDNCLADGVRVLRRHGGGCAVVLDPGNVIVSAALPVDGILGSRRWFNRLSGWLIDGLARAGIEGIRHDGICDLVLNDRKISGACIHRSKDLLFYSATLLVQPDLEKVERYLKHPPREPHYRRGRPHGEFMGALAARLPSSEAEALADRLQDCLPPLPGEEGGGRSLRRPSFGPAVASNLSHEQRFLGA